MHWTCPLIAYFFFRKVSKLAAIPPLCRQGHEGGALSVGTLLCRYYGKRGQQNDPGLYRALAAHDQPKAGRPLRETARQGGAQRDHNCHDAGLS
eukprot:2588220-Pleurochrysis_carterae.AAC.1